MIKKTALCITSLLTVCVLLTAPAAGAAFDVRGNRGHASAIVSDIIPAELSGYLQAQGFDTDQLVAEALTLGSELLFFFESDDMLLVSSARGAGLVVLNPAPAAADSISRLITFDLRSGTVRVQQVSPTCVLQISTALTTLVSAIYSCGFTANPLGCVTSLIGFIALLPIIQTECTAEYALSVTAINGSVSKTPDKSGYRYGEQVRLTAVPDQHYSFVAWSGAASGSENPITITMTADRQVTANFSINTYTLTTPPAAGGIITRSPNATTYTHGLTVTLEARPNAGFAFQSWGGDLPEGILPTDDRIQIIMDGDKTITATFIPASP
jgi:hypothetical protein